MFELVENYTPSAEIKVIGVGGGGGNALNQMVDANIDGVEFIAANTDAQALRNFNGKTVLQIGNNVTKGLGAGANPEVGRQAALEDRDRIMESMHGADMVFITAGMGGGTGTGAAPVIAQAAKEMGILTVAVVTKPFPFEQKRRMKAAELGIEELGHYVDSLITIPNAKLLTVMGGDEPLLNAFKKANMVLLGAVQGIAELITRPGLINVDFADVRTVMSEMGNAMMGTGTARGEDRAIMAAQSAIGSPLLEDINLSGARGLLVNITAGLNLCMRQSGTCKGKFKISKKGRPLLRKILSQISLQLVRKGALYGDYYHEKKERQDLPGAKALTIVMRHFLRKFYGWYRSEQEFNKERFFVCQGDYKKVA